MDNLTPEELGKLFPIELVPFRNEWVSVFESEKENIVKILGKDTVLRIEHIGSTAIAGIYSKPTIDILVEIPEPVNMNKKIIGTMNSSGYHYILRNDMKPPYMNFVKGYNLKGKKEQTFHIYLAPEQHLLWDRVYFRDYLVCKPEIAKEYEKLKLSLAKKHPFNREDYTHGKTEFVLQITLKAKKFYETLKQIATDFNNCINKADINGLSALMSEDHQFIDRDGNIHQPRSFMVEAWKNFFAAYPGYKNTFTKVDIRNSLVVMQGFAYWSPGNVHDPALWTAVIENNRVKKWQVFYNNSENRNILNIR